MKASILDKPWEAHVGLDYAVVMLPGENTETASITLQGPDAAELGKLVASVPGLLTALKKIRAEEGCNSVIAYIVDRALEDAGRS